MWSVFDNLRNFVTGLGTFKDPTEAAHFFFHEIDRHRLESTYRSNWIARAAIDAPAEDATKHWRNWTATGQQIENIEAYERKLMLQRKMKQAIVRGRLYGGAALVIGVDQGTSEEELDFDKVGRDDLKFIAVLNRYELNAGPRIYNVMSRYYTRPEYYTVSTPLFGFGFEPGTVYPSGYAKGTEITPVRAQGQAPKPKTLQEEGDPQRQWMPAQGLVKIHPSRVIEFIGNELPDWRLAPMGGTWSDSILQTVEEPLKDFGMSLGSMAAMVNDAKMDVIKVNDLIMSMTDDMRRKRMLERFSQANAAKGAINTLLLDKEEEWERIQTQFAGLPPVVSLLMVVASAATGVPMTRLMGNAPSGALSQAGGSGGEVDLRNYYDRIAALQETDYRTLMEPLDMCLIRSAIGKYDPNIDYEWAPLYKPDPLQEAQKNFQKAQATQVYVGLGLINEDALRSGVVNQLIEDNVYPGFEDAIEAFGEAPELDDDLTAEPDDPDSGPPTPANKGNGDPVSPVERPKGRALENSTSNQKQSAGL